jgi:hypothetical protein
MVTQAKRWVDEVPVGARCFLEQDYRNRELVIVTKDPHPRMEAWATSLAHPGLVRFFDVSEEAPRATLGELRQFAVEASGGEFVATWDDDDISDPGRLAAQVHLLVGLPLVDAVLLVRMRVDDLVRVRRFVSPYFECEQTMVARRLGLPAYPSMGVGEDCAVIGQLRRIAVLDRPELYTYRIHGGNVAGGPLAREWWIFRTGGDWHAGAVLP